MTNTPNHLPLQPASEDIWDKKYRLKEKNGEPIDQDIDATYRRVARALADVEATPELREEWFEKFLWAMRNGAIPAGRIMSNAGAQEHKPATSAINCTVSQTIDDSMDGIMEAVHAAALTLKAGCVAAGTLVVTEHGVVPIERAVAEKHKSALSYNIKKDKFELKPILRHLTPIVKNEDSIKIVSSDGASLSTSKKHPVLVYRNGELDYIRAGDIRVGDSLVKFNLAWEVDDSKALDAWFVGAHLGDGTCDYWLPNRQRKNGTNGPHYANLAKESPIVRFRMYGAEQDVVEKYAHFFEVRAGSKCKVAHKETRNYGSSVWHCHVTSRPATEYALPLIDGMVGPKSHNLFIPQWIKNNPEKHFIPFLAGLIDTDGTVSKERGSASYSSVCFKFVAELQSMLALFGVSSGLMLTSGNGRTHQLGDRMVVSPEMAVLKISDSEFLVHVAKYMACQEKVARIQNHATKGGMYEKNVITTKLRDMIVEATSTMSHKEKQALRIYNKCHLGEYASRDLMNKWAQFIPSAREEIEFCRKLRHVVQIDENLGLDEQFYDFEVEDHHNYIAGNNGFLTIHNCGIGYEFSTLRPKGAFVAGAGANTSGPLSFMDIFDKMCFTVASAGGRRGAQMGTFDVSHPDVKEFIKSKRTDGAFRQFNLSLLITDEFMRAVEDDLPWKLVFPVNKKELDVVDLEDPEQVVWREWPIHEGYVVNDVGQVACRVYDTIQARKLWDMIMVSTYDYAEPGFVLIDKMNEYNNNWWCENIRATNPCGEQGLPPEGACLLGSVNLTRFVRNPFTENAFFDFDEYRKTVAVFTRMLDNVVEINGLPLEGQRREITFKRRHGMGYLGLGSSLTMLRIPYGSKKSVEFTEKVTRELAVEGWRQALELAKEKGPAPIMVTDYTVTGEMLRKRPEMVRDGYKVGDTIKGSVLHAKYSRYMQKVAEVEPELVNQLAEVGARFTHHSSIAPTGTISLSLANNASNGIEPSFAHHYSRNVIREGRKTKEKVEVYSYELLAYRALVNPDAMPFSDDPATKLPDYFISADDVKPKEHVDIQAAAQKWIDSSISKTANVPTEFPYEDFKDIYLYAYHQGLKGCTTFRFNPAAFQGVLVKEKDLENTIYEFVLEDGSTVSLRGNEMVEYDGETHTAANLFEALKEGYYGKF